MQCECSDPGCRVDHASECPNDGTVMLGRSDYDDDDTFCFCEECAADALESGCFYECEDDGEEGEDDGEEGEVPAPAPPRDTEEHTPPAPCPLSESEIAARKLAGDW